MCVTESFCDTPETNTALWITSSCCLVVKLCLTFVTPHGLCPWDFPEKTTRMGCHFLLQGVFPIQGLNSHYSTLAMCPELCCA